jgi:Arc/MetJ-type ribon-helix-helix transcriptional regulator
MSAMKVSVSLPGEDVDFLDAYAARHGMASRSAVVRRALEVLRATQLGPAYADAWSTWETEDGPAWEVTVADGLTPT